MHAVIVYTVIAVILYVLFHGHHTVKNRRRHGLSVWVSLRGPWGTRISKRF